MSFSSRMRARCWMGLTFGLLAAIAGCGDSQPTPPTPATITEKKFIGRWVENRLPEKSPYHKPSDDPDYRMLEVKDDGTFLYYLSDEAGKPKGEAVVEGTWAISGVFVSLKVSKNTLPPEKHDETPAFIFRVITPETDSTVTAPVIHAGSDSVTKYYRQIK